MKLTHHIPLTLTRTLIIQSIKGACGSFPPHLPIKLPVVFNCLIIKTLSIYLVLLGMLKWWPQYVHEAHPPHPLNLNQNPHYSMNLYIHIKMDHPPPHLPIKLPVEFITKTLSIQNVSINTIILIDFLIILYFLK